MNIALDLILLCIIILTVVLGLSKGFIKSAIQFLGSVLSACLASVFGGMAATWIFNKFFREPFLERISSAVSGLSGEESIVGAFGALPDFILRALQEIGITQENLMARLQTSQGQIAETLVDAVSPVFIMLLKVFAVIILFMLFMIIIKAVSGLLGDLFHLQLLGSVDKLLGAVFGLLYALMLIWLIFAVAGVFVPMMTSEMQQTFQSYVSSTVLLNWLMEYNPLNIMFS